MALNNDVLPVLGTWAFGLRRSVALRLRRPL